MKTFACGDVMPGCPARFVSATDFQLLFQVAHHARRDHGVPEVTESLVGAVHARIRRIAWP